jgi:WD40 repeat protein
MRFISSQSRTLWIGLFVGLSALALLRALWAVMQPGTAGLAVSTVVTPTPVPVQLADDIRLVATLGRGWINDLDWSPDDSTLAVATSTGIWLYNADDLGTEPRLLQGHSAPVSSVDFDPSGARLVSGGWDKMIRLWDTASGTTQVVLSGHTGSVESVAFAPDGARIVSAGFDTSVRQWDAVTGAELSHARVHNNTVTGVAYSPDERFFASGSRFSDALVVLWETASGAPLRTLQGHAAAEVEMLTFSPDGVWLAAAMTDGQIYLYDRSSGQLRGSLPGGGDLAFAPDGTLITINGENLTLWNVESGSVRQTLTNPAPLAYLALSPDGRRLAVADRAGDLRIWELDSGTQVDELTGWHTGAVSAVAFNPESDRVIAGGSTMFGSAGRLNLWDVTTRQTLKSLAAENGAVQSLAVSPDGQIIAVGTEAGVLELRQGVDGALNQRVEGHQGRVLSVVFSPDGQAVATGGDDASARLWDSHTGASRAVLTDLGGPIRHLNLSAEGNLLPSGGVQDVTELAGLDEFNVACTAGGADGVTSMLFSPNQAYVASAYWDNVVKIVDLRTGADHAVLQGHTGSIWSIAFSRDSRYIATASADRTVRLWSVDTGSQLAVLEGHTWDVQGVAFSPDGMLLASGSADGTVRLWQVGANRGASTG